MTGRAPTFLSFPSTTFLQERRPSGGTAATTTTEVSQAPVEIGRRQKRPEVGGETQFHRCRGNNVPSGWWFQIFLLNFHPWENDPVWRLHIFQMSWNQQLVMNWWNVQLYGCSMFFLALFSIWDMYCTLHTWARSSTWHSEFQLSKPRVAIERQRGGVPDAVMDTPPDGF